MAREVRLFFGTGYNAYLESLWETEFLVSHSFSHTGLTPVQRSLFDVGHIALTYHPGSDQVYRRWMAWFVTSWTTGGSFQTVMCCRHGNWGCPVCMKGSAGNKIHLNNSEMSNHFGNSNGMAPEEVNQCIGSGMRNSTKEKKCPMSKVVSTWYSKETQMQSCFDKMSFGQTMELVHLSPHLV